MVTVKDAALFELVHDYFKIYLPNQRRCSPDTIRAYRKAIELLFDFVKEKKRVELCEITFEMIDNKVLSDFLTSLEENDCSISTRNHRLFCIRSFYTYAAQMNPDVVIYLSEIQKVPIKKLTTPNIVKHMNESAVKTLLEQPDVSTKKGLRDQFIMLLMYDTAARIQEILNIRLCDMRLGKTPTVTLHGKGSKIRTVPLMNQTVLHFKNYSKVFHPDENERSEQHLFYTIQHGHKYALNDSTARKFICAYGKMAKEKCSDVPDNVHPHLLRHSRAMHLYQHGMDLTLVSQWLGHAQLDTTLIYAHADTERKRKAIETATSSSSPLKKKFNSERFTVVDDETLKKLYGLK